MNIIYLVINRKGNSLPFRNLKNANAFLNAKKGGKYYLIHKVIQSVELNSIKFTDKE